MNDNAREIFVRNINHIMKIKNKKAAQIARDLNIPLSTISSWTNGQSYPRVDKMQKLADYLNVSMRQLTDDEEENDFVSFTSIDSAMQFIIKSPVASAYGGYDIDKMSEEEIIDFANELAEMFKIMAKRHQK